MAVRKHAGLTEKQETFALVYVQTANAAEAYRQAYDVAPDARDGWVYVEACQLLEHPKVGPRIKELQEKAKERSQYTVIEALSELEQARLLAHSEAQAGAAVSAINGKVKLLGLDKPQRHEHTSPDGSLTPAVSVFDASRLSKEALAELMAAKEGGDE